MIDLTRRLAKCRNKATWTVKRYSHQAGCHTVELEGPDGQLWQWSANPEAGPDSAKAWQGFSQALLASRKAMDASGQDRTGGVRIDLITHPTERGYEIFTWSVPIVKADRIGRSVVEF